MCRAETSSSGLDRTVHVQKRARSCGWLSKKKLQFKSCSSSQCITNAQPVPKPFPPRIVSSSNEDWETCQCDTFFIMCVPLDPPGKEIKRYKPKRAASFFSRQASTAAAYSAVQVTESLEQGWTLWSAPLHSPLALPPEDQTWTLNTDLRHLTNDTWTVKGPREGSTLSVRDIIYHPKLCICGQYSNVNCCGFWNVRLRKILFQWLWSMTVYQHFELPAELWCCCCNSERWNPVWVSALGYLSLFQILLYNWTSA